MILFSLKQFYFADINLIVHYINNKSQIQLFKIRILRGGRINPPAL